MDERPHPDDPAPAPLAPAELASDPRKLAAVLATVLDQQSRDASANRAQARELIRAVEGLAKAHEFLGLELREERRRSRAMLVALIFVPLAVIAGGAVLAASLRGEGDRVAALERGLADVRDRNDAERIAGLRSEFESRLAAASGDAAAARQDLDATRSALAEERRRTEARERDAAEKLAAAERDRAEAAGLRVETAQLREVAGVERARADDLARALADAARRGAPNAPTEVAAPPVAPPPPSGVPASAPPPAVAAPIPPPRVPSPAAAPSAAPVARDPADLERIRTKLNALLEGTTGAARYEFESIGGVSGTDLLGVRVVGRDASGRTLRTVEAARAEISVTGDGKVRVRFAEGGLLVGGRRAPFFDGSYTLNLDASPDPWRSSGLTCIRLP